MGSNVTSSEALEVYLAAEPIDLHVESFVWTRLVGYDLRKRHSAGPLRGLFGRQADFPRMREANIAGGTWVISTNPWRSAAGRARTFEANLMRLKGIIADSDGLVRLVRNYSEYRAARASGCHAAFLGIQGGNALDRDLDALDVLDDGAILRITLVHLSSSKIGATSSPFRLLARNRGLTDFGRAYVRRLNEKKVLVDLAHISPEGFFDAVEVHDKTQPLVVTHTGVSGVHPHWRNLSDAQIRAVAKTGGTIGVMYHSEFLGDPLFGGRSERIVEHMAHIIDVVGDDFVSIGSDWDGLICTPRDMPTCLELPILVQHMLERGWTPERVKKILSGNFLRVLQHVRGVS